MEAWLAFFRRVKQKQGKKGQIFLKAMLRIIVTALKGTPPPPPAAFWVGPFPPPATAITPPPPLPPPPPPPPVAQW